MQSDLDGPGLYPLFRDEHPCDDDSNRLLLVFFDKHAVHVMSS